MHGQVEAVEADEEEANSITYLLQFACSWRNNVVERENLKFLARVSRTRFSPHLRTLPVPWQMILALEKGHSEYAKQM